MDNRAIGVFDSGLGGLTCVRAITKLLPGENIIYFGDTGRVPYGTRSKETIINYTRGDIRFLKSFDIKLAVIACGTASSIALDTVKNEYDFPILGVVTPTAKAAVDATGNGRIGVIGTPLTIKSGKYKQEIEKINKDAFVVSNACSLFVPFVENGYADHEATRLIAKEYLKPIKKAGVDTLILGCTHYPLLTGIIGEIMGEGVTLIDSGMETAKSLKEYLENNNMLSQNTSEGTYHYYVSDSVEGFEALGGMFLNKAITGKVEKIDIEKY